MKEEIKLLMNGVKEDYISKLIDFDEALRRISLIRKYENEELCLKGINSIWF